MAKTASVEPRSEERRDMPIEVIGAGFGRTGTKSLQVALQKLGFGPCYHMTEVFTHPEHLPLWEAAIEGKPVEWERIFGDYQAAVDWPAAAFYRELMERYPQAKVILTVRDPDRWYESAYQTIYNTQEMASSPLFSLGALFVPRLRNMRRAALAVAELAWERTFGGRFEDREHAVAVFERLNEEVKEHVPDERLLVYEVSEGWEPLCEFLGVERPEGETFPHLNDTESFRRTIRRGSALAVGAPAALILVVGLILLLRGRDPSRLLYRR